MNESASQAFENDHLSLEPFSQRLEEFLMIEHGFTDGSLVISLNAPFGSGKSTFLSMWAGDMKTRRQQDAAVPVVLMLNAWESDYCGDPLLAIITGLIQAAKEKGLNSNSDEGKRIREAAKDAAWFTLGLANNLVSRITGIDPLAAGDVAEKRKQPEKNRRQILCHCMRKGAYR